MISTTPPHDAVVPEAAALFLEATRFFDPNVTSEQRMDVLVSLASDTELSRPAAPGTWNVESGGSLDIPVKLASTSNGEDAFEISLDVPVPAENWTVELVSLPLHHPRARQQHDGHHARHRADRDPHIQPGPRSRCGSRAT